MGVSFISFQEHIKQTYCSIIFYFCSITFLKIGFWRKQLRQTLLIITNKLLSIIYATLAATPSAPVALLVFSDRMILLISSILVSGKSNNFSVFIDFLLLIYLGKSCKY